MAELILFAILILAASYVAWVVVIDCLAMVGKALVVLAGIVRKAVCHD